MNIRTVSLKAIVYGVCDKTISRSRKGEPVVGFTLGYITAGITATGTTITTEVVTIGW